MNSSLPSSVCGSANDSSYANTDQASIRSSGHTSIRSTSTSITKPKRTVRFQDPDPADPAPVGSLADSLSFHPGPNLSLSSLDLSSDDGSYTRRSRHSPSSSIAAGKQPMRSSSPRFARPLSTSLRPSMRREMSSSSTASAPGELEFTDWLARMEESKSGSTRPVPKGSKLAVPEGDKEERKKKRRSWVNLLVR